MQINHYSQKEHTKISKITKFGNVKNEENIALQSLQILYTFVLRAENATIFGPNVVRISARKTKVYKICELCKAIFSSFFNIFHNQTL